jgi:hypothetical protein
MERRKFMIGVGSLAAGGAAATGTGAFTTASAERTVTVDVNGDQNSIISLIPNDDLSDISVNNDGELELDLSGASDEGVNINSKYTWGDPSDPSNKFAFAITNNDEQDYDNLVLQYELKNDDWFEKYGDTKSVIRFKAFGPGDPVLGGGRFKTWSSLEAPTNSGNDVSGADASFNSGDTVYIIVEVDTTAPAASINDDLTGTLTINVEGPGGN